MCTKSKRPPFLDKPVEDIPVDKLGKNDATDFLTPISFGGASMAAFPDKARSTSTIGSQPGSASFTFSEMANSRGQQRSRSFKFTKSRSNSFTGFVGPPTSRSMSRQTSVDSNGSARDGPASSRLLKVFVKLPSGSASGGDSELSHEEMEVLQMAAGQDGKSDSDVENRPPSPRPDNNGAAVRLHSEVLENWEDSMRFRCEANPADAKYNRSSGDSRNEKPHRYAFGAEYSRQQSTSSDILAQKDMNRI